MHLVLSASSINLFLATNMEFYAQGWIFFFIENLNPSFFPMLLLHSVLRRTFWIVQEVRARTRSFWRN